MKLVYILRKLEEETKRNQYKDKTHSKLWGKKERQTDDKGFTILILS